MKHILLLSSLTLLLMFTACTPEPIPTVSYEENIKKTFNFLMFLYLLAMHILLIHYYTM